MTLRIGLLSTARINANLAAGAHASSRVRVVAIASRELARAQAQARELGVEQGARRATRRCSPTTTSTPSTSPCPTSCTTNGRCARSPPASTCSARSRTRARPSEVQEAFAAAEAAGVVLAEALMWRHHPQALRLAELVADGAIGELRMVRAAFSFPLDAIRATRACSRGPPAAA